MLLDRFDGKTACDWVCIVFNFGREQIWDKLSQFPKSHLRFLVSERTQNLLWVSLRGWDRWVGCHRAKNCPHASARSRNLRRLSPIARVDNHSRRFKTEFSSREREFFRVPTLFIQIERTAHRTLIQVYLLQGQSWFHQLKSLCLLRNHITAFLPYFFVFYKQFSNPLLVLLRELIHPWLKSKCFLFKIFRAKFVIW